MNEERSSSSEEEENGKVEIIGNFWSCFTIEDFRELAAGEDEESDDAGEGGWVRVYHAGGAKIFLMNAPREASDDDEDDEDEKIIGFMIL